jgi:hypothetical protein
MIIKLENEEFKIEVENIEDGNGYFYSQYNFCLIRMKIIEEENFID